MKYIYLLIILLFVGCKTNDTLTFEDLLEPRSELSVDLYQPGEKDYERIDTIHYYHERSGKIAVVEREIDGFIVNSEEVLSFSKVITEQMLRDYLEYCGGEYEIIGPIDKVNMIRPGYTWINKDGEVYLAKIIGPEVIPTFEGFFNFINR